MCLEENLTSFTVEITEVEEVVITQECNGSELLLTVNENALADFIWMDQNNNVIGSNKTGYNASDYLSDDVTQNGQEYKFGSAAQHYFFAADCVF